MKYQSSECLPLRVAVLGAGAWGTNHVRTVESSPSAVLSVICDPARSVAERMAKLSSCPVETCVERVLASRDVDAVIIAAPALYHAELAKKSLLAGKHVLVEKPVALSVAEARELEVTAAQLKLVASVGHLLLFHPAVVRLKELLSSSALGELFYFHAVRANLGRVRRDENALWSFAPHDISMLDYFLEGALPETISARGHSYLQPGVEDVVFVSLKYPGGVMAHIQLSWLSPRKERRLTIVGSQKMVEFDDVSAEKLRIYDKGYAKPPNFTSFGQYLTIRHGDISIPHIAMQEPLAVQLEHFVSCIQSGEKPRAALDSATRCVQILSAAQRSLERNGSPELVPPIPYSCDPL